MSFNETVALRVPENEFGVFAIHGPSVENGIIDAGNVLEFIQKVGHTLPPVEEGQQFLLCPGSLAFCIPEKELAEWYYAEENIVGCISDGGPPITVLKETYLHATYYELGSIDFDWKEWNLSVCLSRQRVCEDVSAPEYYDNYFAPVKGLRCLADDCDTRCKRCGGSGFDPEDKMNVIGTEGRAPCRECQKRTVKTGETS